LQHLTRAQLEALPTHELVKLYNTIAGQRVQKFSSRAAGIKLLLAALAERAKSAPKPRLAVRTVSKVATNAGRPKVVFSVKMAEEGKSEVRSKSLRGQILAHLKTASNRTAAIADLESKFGDAARGAVLKLLEVGWLVRT
jgi:hypothetical protein